MDEMESLEPEVKKALAKEMKEAKETFDKVSSMLTVKERQELEKDRIMASKKLIIRLKNSKDSDDHYQLLRELEVIRKDEVLATAPQLQEELAAIKKLIAERQAEQKRLLKALDEALKGDDKDVSKKLKIVEAAKAALGKIFKNFE
jgi:molybdopterin converting factor small subunit